MHGWPEAVAGAGEMVADGGGVEAGIDADEEDIEIGADDVGDGFGVGGLELGFGRFPGCGHGESIEIRNSEVRIQNTPTSAVFARLGNPPPQT